MTTLCIRNGLKRVNPSKHSDNYINPFFNISEIFTFLTDDFYVFRPIKV